MFILLHPMLQASFKSENPAKVMYLYEVHDPDSQKDTKIQILNAPQDEASEALSRYDYATPKIHKGVWKCKTKLLIMFWLDDYNSSDNLKSRKSFEIKHWSAPRTFLAINHWSFFSDFPFCTYSLTKLKCFLEHVTRITTFHQQHRPSTEDRLTVSPTSSSQ